MRFTSFVFDFAAPLIGDSIDFVIYNNRPYEGIIL